MDSHRRSTVRDRLDAISPKRLSEWQKDALAFVCLGVCVGFVLGVFALAIAIAP